MLKKFLIVSCLGLAFLAITPSNAQFRAGVQGQIPIGKLHEMEQMLELSDAGQKADLLTRLGVDPASAQMLAEDLLHGQKIELQSVRTQQGTHYGVAFLPCFRGCPLYLLQGSDDDPKKNPWHVIDKQELDCWHEVGVLEFMALRRADADDIVIHHANYGHGSNYVQDQTRIFSILHDKLVQTMVTQDFLSQGTLGGPIEIQTEHKSTFLRFPDRSLEETRTTAVNDKLQKVERRYWRWSEQKQRFTSSRFMTVVVPNAKGTKP